MSKEMCRYLEDSTERMAKKPRNQKKINPQVPTLFSSKFKSNKDKGCQNYFVNAKGA